MVADDAWRLVRSDLMATYLQRLSETAPSNPAKPLIHHLKRLRLGVSATKYLSCTVCSDLENTVLNGVLTVDLEHS
jgi:hypothetical protein